VKTKSIGARQREHEKGGGSNAVFDFVEGVELNDVREHLGHKRMDMVLRYAHLSPRHKARVANILDNWIK